MTSDKQIPPRREGIQRMKNQKANILTRLFLPLRGRLGWGFCIFLFSLSLFSSCDFLFGSKKDKTTEDIFEQGAIDPNLVPNQVGYVPLLPFWKNVSHPVDVFVGYDEMVYIIDDEGLEVFDQKGERHRTIAIEGATDVTQDRRLHTYVTGRINKMVAGTTYNLAAVFHIINASTSTEPLIIDTLIQPFCDVSRNNTAFRGASDAAVQFTGLTTRADNSLLVSRAGPVNDLNSVARPDKTILFFDEDGNNIGYSIGLNPVTSSLKSVLGLSSITSFATPPQSITGINTSHDFLILQQEAAAQFKALWIKETYDPDAGISYIENSSLTQFDFTKADGFLYTANRFSNPTDICVSGDASQYIFIVDAGKDSLYQFTQKGYEGVNPAANSGSTKQVLASFGGLGAGPFQFDSPSGVCYFKKVIYVADKNNNRICRYILSTDLE